MYRIQQFAQLAGVTVRTLHHYDRLGLLSPQQRTEKGYRLYRPEDLAQLERILVLRYMGLSLQKIATLLPTQHAEETLAETLRIQAAALRERRNGLDRILKAIETAERSLHTTQRPDWDLLRSILKEVQMQENTEWTEKYYSEEASQFIDQHKAEWTPEMQHEITLKWQQLFTDVEAAIAAEVDPASPQAADLAARWSKLVAGFTKGNAEVQRGLNRMYQDQPNWPAETRQRHGVKPELSEFIRKASAAH